MERRRERVERVALAHLKKIKLGDDVTVEVGGPATVVVATPKGPSVEIGFVMVVTLGHNLLGVPPITAPAVMSGLDINDERVTKLVEQLLEGARNLRDKLAHPALGPGNELGASLRSKPVKLG